MATNKGMLFSVKSKKGGGISLNQNNEEHLRMLRCKLADSRTMTDFKQRIHKIVNAMGFTDFIFMRMERNWQSNSQQGLLHSLPAEFMRIYLANCMHAYDLLIPYGKNNTQPIFSSQAYGYIDNAPFEIDLVQNNRTLRQLYRRFRYFEHYVIPMNACDGGGNVQLILTDRGADKSDFQSKVTPMMPACRLLCNAIDTVSTKIFPSSFINSKNTAVNITQKSLRLLKNMANHDCSITQLAEEMCISPITAHQHIAIARKALGVQTNIAAIIKAFKAGLINFE